MRSERVNGEEIDIETGKMVAEALFQARLYVSFIVVTSCFSSGIVSAYKTISPCLFEQRIGTGPRIVRQLQYLGTVPRICVEECARTVRRSSCQPTQWQPLLKGWLVSVSNRRSRVRSICHVTTPV